MSSFNNVTKIRYEGDDASLVPLQEYIIFADDKAKRKYIIFKFANNVTQQLIGMRFEVFQYDVDGNLVEQSQVVYTKRLAGPEEEFVPRAKLPVSYACTSISIKLIAAAFDRFKWTEGEFEDNTYNFQHFFNDEVKYERSHEKPKKPPKKKRVKKKKAKKRRFIMRDSIRKNIAKLPIVFNVIICLLVIAYTVTTLLLFRRSSYKFTVGDYYVSRVANNQNQIAIYGYGGTATDIVIPEQLIGYDVVAVYGGAFKNTNLTSVTFEGSLTVYSNAFENCTAMRTVTAAKPITVQSYGFTECNALIMLNVPSQSYMYAGSLYNCNTGVALVNTPLMEINDRQSLFMTPEEARKLFLT